MLAKAISERIEAIRNEELRIRENENFSGEAHEYFQQQVIRLAIEAADSVILEASDGSVEETDYLTAKVVEGLTTHLYQRIWSALRMKEMNERKEEEKRQQAR